MAKLKMKNTLMGILAGILVIIMSTGIMLAFIHISDVPYIFEIDAQNIEESSKMDREEILSNYNAVLDYLSPFSSKEFSLPTLKFTEMGAYHFAECKVFFNVVYGSALLAGILLVLLGLKNMFSSTSLIIGGAFGLCLPVTLGTAIAINFDKAFTFFHTLFFDGDTYLFDPAKDQIINILPPEFFMHCAIMFACFWIMTAFAVMFIGIVIKKKERS